ncbi:Uncharacterised protein [Bordetella pertussis]|nr:Uncharacterised protein [Bordetella pertussis]
MIVSASRRRLNLPSRLSTRSRESSRSGRSRWPTAPRRQRSIREMRRDRPSTRPARSPSAMSADAVWKRLRQDGVKSGVPCSQSSALPGAIFCRVRFEPFQR